VKEGNSMKLKFVSENDTRDDHTPIDRSSSRITAHFRGTGIYIYWKNMANQPEYIMRIKDN
jgi:hypothetical protein